MDFLHKVFGKKQSNSNKSQVKKFLLGLPVVKEENISNYSQAIIRAESHPSMFMGSTDEAIGFVARMCEETEKFILSCEGITRVQNNFLINNYRVGEDILEIQYMQYWNNGTRSVYSEHVMRIGEDRFEVFGSKMSANRMKAVWK